MKIQLLDHNFNRVRIEKDTSMHSAPDHEAMWLNTAVDGKRSTGRRFRYAVFIGPKDAPAVTDFMHLKSGKHGFRVHIGEQRYRVVFDPGNRSITLK